jgi:hypothetical protein
MRIIISPYRRIKNSIQVGLVDRGPSPSKGGAENAPLAYPLLAESRQSPTNFFPASPFVGELCDAIWYLLTATFDEEVPTEIAVQQAELNRSIIVRPHISLTI